MSTYYSAEENVQILIALMKEHGVRKVVASPGTTNVCFVASLQYDTFFEIYSAADERSAAYIACGLAAESGEPVVITCTQATASRNYMPALTEAYYRRLPILAVTATRHESEVGHKLQQVIDRSVLPNDIAKLSVSLPMIHTEKERWSCVVNANKALLELKRHGGGPVHINLGTEYTQDFTVQTLPKVRKIERYFPEQVLPLLIPGNIGIFVASHLAWDDDLTDAVDSFCEKYDAVVLCDHTSNYRGRYGVMEKLVANQKLYHADCNNFTTLIHIGNMSGSYLNFHTERVWRVSPDGEICDPFEKLTAVFEMEELYFFNYYLNKQSSEIVNTSFYEQWKTEFEDLTDKAISISEKLPYSNIWVAQQTLPKLPDCSVLHLGIYNTLRSWSFFKAPKNVLGFSNVGGFGIDGNVSSLIGASLVHPDKLYFGVVGDLSFFYDMNSLGNRHIGKNIRLMLINNGRGTEFTNMDNFTFQAGIDKRAVSFIAAEGHYGNQSRNLVKHYAEDLGFCYLSASNKTEYLEALDKFVTPEIGDKPILFEVFTDSNDERDALEMMYTLKGPAMGKMKQVAKSVLGEKGVQVVKKILRK